MADILRITDRFKITGRGTVYIVEKNWDAVVHIGDMYKDLRGNRFKVKGIEMIRRIPDGKSLAEMPLGLMFELVDRIEARGNILVKEQQKINFIFCNHPLYPSVLYH